MQDLQKDIPTFHHNPLDSITRQDSIFTAHVWAVNKFIIKQQLMRLQLDQIILGKKWGTHDSWFVAAHYRPPNYKKNPPETLLFFLLHPYVKVALKLKISKMLHKLRKLMWFMQTWSSYFAVTDQGFNLQTLNCRVKKNPNLCYISDLVARLRVLSNSLFQVVHLQKMLRFLACF